MKKLLSTLLLIVMLCQVLPFDAMATVGKVLTDDELARAYALTGLGQHDGLYHNGMMPNASMSGMQLARWLESQLDNQVHTIDDVLARARYQIFYLMILQPDSKAGLTHKLSKGYYTRTDKDEDHFLVTAEPVGTYTVQAGTYEAHTMRYYYDSIATPEITWAKVNRRSNKVLGLELFGTFGRVNYTQDELAYGITSFFEDISMALMNAGNLGVATFDIAMYEVTNGQEGKKPVETVHVNCIDPEKSKVTMQNGKEELTGKKVARRVEDFDYTARQRQWYTS